MCYIALNFYVALRLKVTHAVVYMLYDMIYLLITVGLAPGGSSTVHIYTQTIHRTTQLIWE